MRLVAKLGEKGRARWMAGGVKLIREVTMSSKTVGNLILMTLICVVIFWVFMALRPARADGAMPDAMVGSWCYVNTKYFGSEFTEVFRRGKCRFPKQLTIRRDGFIQGEARCRLLGTDDGPKALLATFDCWGFHESYWFAAGPDGKLGKTSTDLDARKGE